MRKDIAIVGSGTSLLGEQRSSTSQSLMLDAITAALADSGIERSEVDGLILRGPDDEYNFQQQVGQQLGLDVTFATSLDNGGASQALGVILASLAIEAGLATTVVCGYARNAWSRTRLPGSRRAAMSQAASGERDREFQDAIGLFGQAATHAFGATRHMALYGTTKEQLGHVALAFREHASRNPHAYKRAPLVMDDYLDARLITEPFGLLDCSPRTDGAGAVIVSDLRRRRSYSRPAVRIAGFGTQNNLRGWFAGEHMTSTAAGRSGELAYAMAGLKPANIDCAQLYDCFTYMALVQLEDYGFCSKGEGGAFAASGALAIDGAMPTNTSGGQLSEGHVEGMLQVVEGVRQLNDSHPPERQVQDAEFALVSGHGGNTVSHSTLILQRSA